MIVDRYKICVVRKCDGYIISEMYLKNHEKSVPLPPIAFFLHNFKLIEILPWAWCKNGTRTPGREISLRV